MSDNERTEFSNELNAVLAEARRLNEVALYGVMAVRIAREQIMRQRQRAAIQQLACGEK